MRTNAAIFGIEDAFSIRDSETWKLFLILLSLIMDIYAKATFLSEFLPKNLSKKAQNHEWIFAEYFEYPEHRKDETPYRAFLFRNKKRTIFGLKEFYRDSKTDFRVLAAKVVADENLRESMISDDEDLPKIWKRH